MTKVAADDKTGIGEDVVLEALKRADQRIRDTRGVTAPLPWDQSDQPVWRFSIWNSCTCGHIYVAAVGERAPHDGWITDAEGTDGLYEACLRAIVRENSDLGPDEVRRVASFVSDLTSDLGYALDEDDFDEDETEVTRQAALNLIGQTIDRIELRHRQAMRQLAEGS